MFEFDGIRNPRVEHQDRISGQVTTWYMTEDEMKEKWGESVELTEKNYSDLKADGWTEKEIAQKWNISQSRLSQKKKAWREEGQSEDPVTEKVDEREVESVDETVEGSDGKDWVQRYEDMKKERDEWMEKHESTVQDFDLLNQEFSDMEVRALQAEDELERYKEAAEGQTEVFNRTGQAYKELEQERDYWKQKANRYKQGYLAAEERLQDDIEGVTDETIQGYKMQLHDERIARQALEEKVEYYENQGDVQHMVEKLKEVIRKQAEVI